MEKAAADARAAAERLTAGATEARRAYETASRTADGTGCDRGLRNALPDADADTPPATGNR